VIYDVHCPLVFNTFGKFSDETIIADIKLVLVFWQYALIHRWWYPVLS
jgi:hypothetical protein